MGQHVKLPGFVPLNKYMNQYALGAIETLAWLTLDPESPLVDEIQERFPEEDRDRYLVALKEIGVLAQEALAASPK